MKELNALELNGNEKQNACEITGVLKEYFGEKVQEVLKIIQEKGTVTTRGQYKKLLIEAAAEAAKNLAEAAAAAAADVNMSDANAFSQPSQDDMMQCSPVGGRRGKKGGSAAYASLVGQEHAKQMGGTRRKTPAKTGGSSCQSNSSQSQKTGGATNKKPAAKTGGSKSASTKTGGNGLADILKPFGFKGGKPRSAKKP
jgi:hypothetical protein